MADVLWTAPVATGAVDALVSVPGSKSLTARWMMLAAMSEEPSRLRGALVSRDTRLMHDALLALGAFIDVDGEELEILPVPPASEHPSDPLEIHVGLAGTVMRFVPFLAALHHGDVRFVGDEAALARPLGPVIDTLRAQGVDVTEHGEPGHLPITVHGRGRLSGGYIEIDASASSQFISGAILAAPRGEADLVLRHVGAGLPSLPHIEMTIATLQAAGVNAFHRTSPDGYQEWVVKKGPIRVGRATVEPDLSNAGPFLAAALVTGGTIAVADWPEYTTQPGDAFRMLLARMGATVEREDDEMVFTGTGTIRGIDVNLSEMGELTPTLAALATLADSPSHLRGIAHLRGHETDRLAALANELNRLGATVVEHPDSLHITPGPLSGTVFHTYEDHRMATAAAIIGLRVPDVKVINIETTQKTLPDFVGMWLSMLHTDKPAGETW